MYNFIKCPFCSGHEAVTPEAASIIRESIALHLHRWRGTLSNETVGELENICNMIDNTAEREQPQEEPEPICPTPGKAKYANRKHALPNAVKWKQHPYACQCGWWHLSKQSETEHTAKINSAPASADEFDSIDPLML